MRVAPSVYSSRFEEEQRRKPPKRSNDHGKGFRDRFNDLGFFSKSGSELLGVRWLCIVPSPARS